MQPGTLFVSPLDDQLISLSIAARLVLDHVRDGRYVDPDESPLPELQRTARDIAALVPLFRLRHNDAPAPLANGEAMTVDAERLGECAVRRGDLRTALLRLGRKR